VKIHCFWLITSKLTLPTRAYFWYGGTHIDQTPRYNIEQTPGYNIEETSGYCIEQTPVYNIEHTMVSDNYIIADFRQLFILYTVW